MIKFCAKLFSFTGLVFFLGTLFSGLVMPGSRPDLIDALAGGLLFGAIMTLILGTVHYLKARKAAAGDERGDIYTTTQVREFESGLEYDRLFTTVAHYLKETAGFTLTESDHDAGRLAARTPFNFISFGSKVTVQLEKRAAGPALVRIVSKPLVITTLADYGDNLKIVKALEEHLRAGERG